jgi:hypothetical protein
MTEAVVLLVFHLNGGNLHDSGHSVDSVPTAAKAD